jgi:hypothetical protein
MLKEAMVQIRDNKYYEKYIGFVRDSDWREKRDKM